jgi:hypothetical protein
MAKKAEMPSLHPPEPSEKEKEEKRVADFTALQWFPLGRGAGKDEFLYCRLLTPGTTGPWLIASVVERRGYSTKAKHELTNETIVTDAMTRSMVIGPGDPRSAPKHRLTPVEGEKP